MRSTLSLSGLRPPQGDFQLAYEDDGTTAGALTLAYEIVPNLTITPEINYTSFGGERSGFVASDRSDAFEFIIRVQRNF